MKVAIVHDWLVGGGAEQVVLELHKLYPDAPIYTSYCTPEWREKLDNKVITGWLQHLGKIRKFIPLLRIWWFTSLDFAGYDLVISSSGNGEAFGIKTPDNTLHVNYCHAPTHFYWRFYNEYMRSPGFGIFNPLARLGLWLLVKPLRAWDYKAAQRPDYFIANSTHIQSEIKKFYGRDSVVIYPPVNTKKFSAVSATNRHGFIAASRLVPQKRLDLIIGAANELKIPLTIIGRGPEYKKLAAMTGEMVKLTGWVSDEEMSELYAKSAGFIFASYEDFGVAPVEALAAGIPVIAYKAGGALDYIKPGINGEFFDVQTVASLCSALQKFNKDNYQEKTIKQSAEKFSIDAFRRSMLQFISNLDKI